MATALGDAAVPTLELFVLDVGITGSVRVGSGSGWIVAGTGRMGARSGGVFVGADAGALERSTRIGTAGDGTDGGASVEVAFEEGARPPGDAGGMAESGSNAIATSAASAKADVSACLTSLASMLSCASTSPGDCSLTPSLQATARSAATDNAANEMRVCIDQPIRWGTIGCGSDSCAAGART
jgi:hypothetical protein